MFRRRLVAPLLLGFLALAPTASAQTTPAAGWALNRYDAPFGGDLTLVADMPWYTGEAGVLVRAALTADHAYRPLVLRQGDRTDVIVEHMLVTHAQLAFAFADRLGLAISLPVSFLQEGPAVSATAPIPQRASGIALSDLRLGARLRIFGHADREPFSLHLAASGYVPGLAEREANTTDGAFRLRVAATAAGAAGAVRWSLSVGTHLRFAGLTLAASQRSPGVSIDHELAVTGALHFAAFDGRLLLGPEFSLATPFAQAFQNENVHAEALLTSRVFVADGWSLGLGVGPGITQGAGTPAVRALFQFAYTPRERRAVRPAPEPPRDRDHDGVLDADDLCPEDPQGQYPDPDRRGCPTRDRDFDGVPDARDLGIEVPQGPNPDRARPGCPRPDADGDGVFDDEDRCVSTPAGANPDPDRPGCPDGDRDGDHVLDHADQCPDTPDGLHPDPDRLGCPAPDRDGDTVTDANDACPDRPGAPSPDPRRHGCPGLVRIVDGRINILRPVFFATNRDVILPQSFPVLTAVRDAMVATPEIRRISIEGHTDDVGRDEANLDLSERRAASVRRWLEAHQIEASRLESHGFGETRPIVPNSSAGNRAQNRRVEFRIAE